MSCILTERFLLLKVKHTVGVFYEHEITVHDFVGNSAASYNNPLLNMIQIHNLKNIFINRNAFELKQ